MLDKNAFYKISYGLYIVCAGNKQRGNGYISNSVFQVTSMPPQFGACCNKDNYTCDLIKKHGHFSVSVLSQNASADIFGRFGYRSGKDFDKFAGMNIRYGESGTPIILNDSIATMEFKVVSQIDLGTHMLFIAELLSSVTIDGSADPMTYAYYREVRKGIAPKNAPTYVDPSKSNIKGDRKGIYKCTACGHIYDEGKEDIPFADLPSDWKCPVCGADKEDFIEVKS